MCGARHVGSVRDQTIMTVPTTKDLVDDTVGSKETREILDELLRFILPNVHGLTEIVSEDCDLVLEFVLGSMPVLADRGSNVLS